MQIVPHPIVESLLRAKPEHYDVISIGRDVPRRVLCRRQLVLDFADLSSVSDGRDGAHPDDSVPRQKHVTAALAFARRSDDDRLLIHCLAGVSRSPAIAWCILLDRLGDPAEATRCLFRLQPTAMPNPVIVRLGLDLLKGSAREFATIRAEMRRLSRHPRKNVFM